MNCRNCGAAMVPVSDRAYFHCLHCRSFEFPTTNEDGIVAIGELTELPCPICNSHLTSATIEGYSISFCNTCRGFLTTNAEFSEILFRRRSQVANQPDVSRTFDPAELKRRIACPKCRKKMDTHPYGGGGNVVIDTCARCQLIWFDARELEVLARHRPQTVTLGQSKHWVENCANESNLDWDTTHSDSDTPGLLEMLARLL